MFTRLFFPVAVCGACTGFLATVAAGDAIPEAGSADAAAEIEYGRAVFDRIWQPAPGHAGTDGLGPLFNASSCAGCHDAPPPPDADGPVGAPYVLRLSAPAPDDAPMTEAEIRIARLGGTQQRRRGDPHLGGQLQDRSVPGLQPEGSITIVWKHSAIVLHDGTVIDLRRPVPSPRFRGQELSPGTTMSLRIAPRLAGLAVLEAVPDTQILSRQDPDDLNGDGISGRANIVWSGARLAVVPGRFGWKATEATLRDQSAAAFASDMGLSSFLRPEDAGDCTALQVSCLAFPGGAEALNAEEVSDRDLAAVTAYAGRVTGPTTSLPAGRGHSLFVEAGCADCHLPEIDIRATNATAVHPYTDLLLHDMGSGLADELPAGRATGAEWRTAPLMGLGQSSRFLHDGRARSLVEAILWHDGEAGRSRERFMAMPRPDREALLAWLGKL